MEKQQATLVIFKPGVDPERIKRWIEALKEKGVVEKTVTQDFNQEHEYPVLYFP